MGNQEESVVFFFPLAIHLPTRLIPPYVPPFPLFFRYHFFCIPPSCLGSPSLNLSVSVTPSNLKTCHLEEIPKQVWSAHCRKFLFIRREHFTILISDLRRKQGPKSHSTEWWNGGISYDTKCLVVWNKSLTKMELQWNKKTIFINRKN